jgi:phenylpropionate dioxygenase-like ring-hydroxylating dioxygenase large terminal subunit
MTIRDLIDVKNGTASREIFVDRDIYRQEQEQIFARAWLFVGHESQVPNPDDFYVSRMGEESVILTRDRGGKLHVFLNSCRHRGMKLCRHDEGNTRLFSCPYHAWSYSTDGALVSTPGELFGVPGYKRYYHEEPDKKAVGTDSRRSDGQLPRDDLGHLGSRCCSVRRLFGRHASVA